MKRIFLLVALMAVVAFTATAEARAPYSSRGAAKIAQSEELSGDPGARPKPGRPGLTIASIVF